MYQLHLGDCLEVLKTLPDACADSVVTDPPYELGFMGKKWDASGIAYNVALWTEALRVLRPGGHLLAFGGTRTYHRMACAIEDAGFEVRDSLHWIYGSGFPKSSRVNRDPRFCQCAELARSAESNTLAQQQQARNGTAVDVADDAPPASSAARCLHEVEGCPADCRQGHGSSDEQPPQRRANDQGCAPSQVCAQGHSHSAVREDDPASEPSDSPCPAQCSCHPSNLDLRSRETIPSGAVECNRRHREALAGASRSTDIAKQADHTQRTALTFSAFSDSASGFPACQACGKPAADGFGTALKPAHEPVVVARKPLVGTVADNVQTHGTGALNIDGCRVQYANAADMDDARVPQPAFNSQTGAVYGFKAGEGRNGDVFDPSKGRWPPNILLSHTPECGETCDETCAVAEMDRQSPVSGTPKTYAPQVRDSDEGGMFNLGKRRGGGQVGDVGGASRFFPVFRYQAKASRSEREAGLREAKVRTGCGGTMPVDDQGRERDRFSKVAANTHPTVKPVELMRWLVRLVTPPGGVVLDPFTGSGTTGVAAMQRGFAFIGIEREPEYHAIATARIEHAIKRVPAQMELTPA